MLRVAKYHTKSGKQTLVRQFHLPPGNQFDQRITKAKAESAWESIRSGSGVAESLREHKVSWNALVRYTSYVPVRKVLTTQKVRRAIELIREGWSLSEALTETRISSRTFWRRTGGVKELIIDRLSPQGVTTQHPFLES